MRRVHADSITEEDRVVKLKALLIGCIDQLQTLADMDLDVLLIRSGVNVPAATIAQLVADPLNMSIITNACNFIY